jgi:hypothetical protein
MTSSKNKKLSRDILGMNFKMKAERGKINAFFNIVSNGGKIRVKNN